MAESVFFRFSPFRSSPFPCVRRCGLPDLPEELHAAVGAQRSLANGSRHPLQDLRRRLERVAHEDG